MIKTNVVAAAAILLANSSGAAMAAKKCNIVGTFTDSVGSTGKFVSEKKGTVSNPLICGVPYALTVTTLTKTTVDITGKAKKNQCGALTGEFTFNNGGCDSASGTVTIAGFGSFADTITRTGKLEHEAAPDTSNLTHGLN